MAMLSREQLREKELVSPERTKIRAEPRIKNSEKMRKKVAVVYYLSRNGHLDHPHFMEVSLSSSHGLFLKDVINRLNALRGEGLACLYSWSAKRSYKNGYVWHDLTKEDFIHPVHGNEYVLKGTELLVHHSRSCSGTTVSATSSIATSSTSSSTEKLLEISKPSQEISNFSKKSNWGSLDLTEYYAYKPELPAYENNNVTIDASTQIENTVPDHHPTVDNATIELSTDEISPPPSSSSPDQVETGIKSGRLILGEEDQTVGNLRGKASGVLMQLISCGISVKAENGRRLIGGSNRFGGDKMEKRDSLSKIDSIKRSSSYNAERGEKIESQKEMDAVHSKCMPRNYKLRKENGTNSYLPPLSRSSNGSKRFNH